MNFYVILGHAASTAVLAVTLDKSAQDDLTAMFNRLATDVVESDHVAFDPGYRADQGEIVTISPYRLPTILVSLESATAAADLPAVTEKDIVDGALRGIAGVEWKGGKAHRTVVQRLESRYVLRPEGRRFFLAGKRFVRDDRAGVEILERVDAVVEGRTLYIASWTRTHAVLDLSNWVREATMAEAERFVKNKRFSLSDDFDLAKVIDAGVRRKITSISENGVVNRATPAVLRKYAATFNVDIEVVQGKIVLPAAKKRFKAVLGLLDQDLLLFEPTGDHWIVNSKRRPS
jgi:hypothetical protein